MMGTQDSTTRDFSLDVLGEKVNARSLDAALTSASLDWTVTKRPLTASWMETRFNQYAEMHTVPVPGKHAVVRSTVGEGTDYLALGVVGDRYTPVQNRRAFGFVDDLLHLGGGDLEVDFAGSMHNGRKVFLSVKLPQTIMVGDSDPVETRLLCVNTHDGTAPFSLSLHVNRLFCTNQIEAVRRNAKRAQQHWSIRHTTGIEGRVQLAREQLNLTVAAHEEFEREAQELIRKTVNNRQVDRLIDSTFAISHDASKAARDSKMRARMAVRTIYRESPTQENIRGTAWGLLNAFVEYADWYREVRPGKRGDTTQARALAQLDSRQTANFKGTIMERVLAIH